MMHWGWLFIPVLGLSMAVGSLPISGGTWDNATLGEGLAYLQGLTWARTDAGRTVIVGHGDRAFAQLHTLHVGDRVALMMDGVEVINMVVYDMYWTTVDDVSLMTTPTDEWELVLSTCSADESHRLIVRIRTVD